MPAKEVTRDYKFEDAKLSTEAGRIKMNVSRDKTEFATRNVDSKNLDALQTAIDGFDNYPTDEELQGDAMEATADKDKLGNSLKMQIRVIRNMADLQYKGTGKYKSFGFEGLDKADDSNLYWAALRVRVVRIGTKLLPDLAGRGLTTDMLTTLSGTATNFHDALETQAEAIEDRDMATQDRVNLGNALYAIVVELASIGKSLFVDKDEARYNDYVLYAESSSGDAPAAPTI